jgi:hypothetical protein
MNNGHQVPLYERILRRTVPVGDCLVWQGAVNKKGYGVIGRGRAGEGNVLTHRGAWESVNGPVPPGIDVRHSCDNPPCVAIGHLLLGTRKQNMQDAVDRGRTARGQRNGRSTLTDDDIRAIRAEARIASGVGKRDGNTKQIAEKYGVTPSTVGLIVRRKRWAHVA